MPDTNENQTESHDICATPSGVVGTAASTDILGELDDEPALPVPDVTSPAFRRALATLRDELLAMGPAELLPVNVDVPGATLLVVGAAPEIRRYRPEMVEWFGEEMAAKSDRLELLARAAGQAHARHLAIETGIDILPLSNAVMELRASLHAEVLSLVRRKIVAAGALGELRGTKGYKNQAFDVLQLIAIVGAAKESLAHCTGLSEDDLDRAEGLANRLVTAVGLRDQGARSPSADLRQRAFSLLAETYDDVRRMISFLRWKHGDADRIAPSLYRVRKTGRTKDEDGETAGAPVSPTVIAPGLPGAPPFASE